ASLAPTDVLTVTIVVIPTTEARLNFTATVSAQNDGNPSNDSVTIHTQAIYTFTVLNTNDSGFGSLRQAILNADAHRGPDLIDFKIPGNGSHLIQPLTPLPPVLDATTIDATTQPGFVDRPVV